MTVPRHVAVGMFVRCLFIQASWSYERLLGGGFAFALLPALRRIYQDDPEGLNGALRRHITPFNAHPYLAGLAVGSVARLEAAGTAPEQIQRFKEAVRGSLGGLGDHLAWAAWRPVTLLGAILLLLYGAPPLVVVVAFLAVYNAGHVALRVWALATGLSHGADVAGRVRSAKLPIQADRLQAMGSLLLGIVLGSLLAGRLQSAVVPGLIWAFLAVIGFALGLRAGHTVLRPAAGAIVALLVLLTFLEAL